MDHHVPVAVVHGRDNLLEKTASFSVLHLEETIPEHVLRLRLCLVFICNCVSVNATELAHNHSDSLSLGRAVKVMRGPVFEQTYQEVAMVLASDKVQVGLSEKRIHRSRLALHCQYLCRLPQHAELLGQSHQLEIKVLSVQACL